MARFESRPADLSHLVDPAAPARFSVSVVPSSDPLSELGRSVEAEVFGEVFGNEPSLLRAEYDPFEAQSVFVVVCDHGARLPVGVARCVVPGPAGFKSLEDVSVLWGESAVSAYERLPFPVDTSLLVDVATLAVLKPYRRGTDGVHVSLAVYRALTQLCMGAGLSYAAAIMDTRALRAVNAATGGAMVAVPGLEPRSYLDSPLSVASVWDVRGFEPALLSAKPDLHALFYGPNPPLAVVTEPDWSASSSLLGARAV